MRPENAPPEWSQEKLQAFNALMDALRDYELYTAVIGRLNLNAGGPYTEARIQIRNKLFNDLGPAFVNAPLVEP